MELIKQLVLSKLIKFNFKKKCSNKFHKRIKNIEKLWNF